MDAFGWEDAWKVLRHVFTSVCVHHLSIHMSFVMYVWP